LSQSLAFFAGDQTSINLYQLSAIYQPSINLYQSLSLAFFAGDQGIFVHRSALDKVRRQLRGQAEVA